MPDHLFCHTFAPSPADPADAPEQLPTADPSSGEPVVKHLSDPAGRRDCADVAYKVSRAKERERLVVPAASLEVGKLADRYASDALGEISVRRQGAATVFDFGEWKSSVPSRKNDDGTISFFTIDPGTNGFEFVVGERKGKLVLVLRDAQHEYVFTEA